MALTLPTHARSVLNYFHRRITSGKMEGINNKIGHHNCMAYGHCDTDFLLKIFSLHESAFFLSGV